LPLSFPTDHPHYKLAKSAAFLPFFISYFFALNIFKQSLNTTQRGQAATKQVYDKNNFPTDRNNATDEKQKH
jgi:hypothetical protein